MEAIEIRQREHGKEKRILVEQNQELKDVVRALKVSIVYNHLSAVLLGAVSVGLSQDHLNENSLHAQYFIDMDMRGEKFIHTFDRKNVDDLLRGVGYLSFLSLGGI